jgi:hypothetical protein
VHSVAPMSSKFEDDSDDGEREDGECDLVRVHAGLWLNPRHITSVTKIPPDSPAGMYKLSIRLVSGETHDIWTTKKVMHDALDDLGCTNQQPIGLSASDLRKRRRSASPVAVPYETGNGNGNSTREAEKRPCTDARGAGTSKGGDEEEEEEEEDPDYASSTED